MSPRYLLDTNIVSDLIRNPQGSAWAGVEAVGDDAVCTSIIVAAEVRYGLVKRGSERIKAQAEAILATIDMLPFEEPAEHRYAALRVNLERRGLPIGNNDMLIAAHALAADCILVTANVREFERVEGLRIENWLA